MEGVVVEAEEEMVLKSCEGRIFHDVVNRSYSSCLILPDEVWDKTWAMRAPIRSIVFQQVRGNIDSSLKQD